MSLPNSGLGIWLSKLMGNLTVWPMRFRQLARAALGVTRQKARVEFIDASRQQRYIKMLNTIGVLNYGNMQASGEHHFLTTHLSKLNNPTVFDVGAYNGAYSAAVREINPSARVFAFEPHPASHRRLIEYQPWLSANAFQVALSDHDGSGTIFDYEGQHGSEHASIYSEVITTVHRAAAASQEVELRSIDSLARELSIDRIDLLKIDTEGHELAVLRGAADLIRRQKVPLIHFEFNEMNIISRTFFKDFFDFLPEYQFYRMLPDALLFIGGYSPVHCEIFAYQNIACVHRGHKGPE
jgi:FkbM family methyltransferase